MTATDIMREMDALPPADLAAVVRHAKELEGVRQLSPEELGVLLDQYIEATDPAEVARLNQALTQGFYGRR
jgi:hypothetical protein